VTPDIRKQRVRWETPDPPTSLQAPEDTVAPEPRSVTAVVPVVIPLSAAAAAAFPRLDLTADDARRLAQGARLPLPSNHSHTGHVPLAAFDPDGNLIALVTVDDGRLRSLAVFVDAAAKPREPPPTPTGL